MRTTTKKDEDEDDNGGPRQIVVVAFFPKQHCARARTQTEQRKQRAGQTDTSLDTKSATKLSEQIGFLSFPKRGTGHVARSLRVNGERAGGRRAGKNSPATAPLERERLRDVSSQNAVIFHMDVSIHPHPINHHPLHSSHKTPRGVRR